jgi:hypothetical protein
MKDIEKRKELKEKNQIKVRKDESVNERIL